MLDKYTNVQYIITAHFDSIQLKIIRVIFN